MLKKSIKYSLLQKLVRWAHNFYYQEIVIEGVEKLPKDKALMLCPNHQNALMDPLAIICSTNLQPIFLTRADIFSNPILKKIFYAFRMLPIYRQRDGGNVVERNQEIFDTLVNILSHKQTVALFPEATHWGYRSLKPIKKGAARIALMSEEANNWKLDLQIVPCFIYFSNYEASKSKLYVSFGKPFGIANFEKTYSTNKDQAIREVNKVLSSKMKEQMLHIGNNKYHDTILKICDIYNHKTRIELQLSNNFANSVLAKKELANQIRPLSNVHTSELENISYVISEFEHCLTKNKLDQFYSEDEIQRQTLQFEITKLTLLSPIYIFGFFFNWIPLQFPDFYARKTVKDPLFRSSFKLILSMFGLPIYYGSVYGLLLATGQPHLHILIILVLGAASANYATQLHLRIKSLRDKMRFLKKNENGTLKQLHKLREAAIQQIDSFLKLG